MKINQREESSQELGETMNTRFVLSFLVLIGVGFPTLIQADESHIVRKGDTLSTIAKKYQGVSWKQICDDNDLPNCDRIRIGEEIRIPSSYYKEENDPNVQSKEVTTAVPVNIESGGAFSKENVSEERRVEMPTADGVSSNSIEDVFNSAIPLNLGVTPDEISLVDAKVFERTQEIKEQKEEIISLQKQINEFLDYKERMSSMIHLQREKISSYTLFIFLSVLGNILLSLLLMRDLIKRRLRARTRFFAVSQSNKKGEESEEVYNLRCEINALKNKNAFLGEEIKRIMQRKMLLSINGKSYEVFVSNFDLDKFTKKAIPIITFLSEGKRFTLKIFNVKRFEKWLGEKPGRIFQILDPVLVVPVR